MEIFNNANATYVFNGSSDENNITSNTNSLELLVSQGLSLTKTANPTTYLAGEIIDYTITITNTSSSFLNGVRIIDNLGGGNLAYVLGSANLTVGSLTYNVNPVNTNPLTFTLQQLGVGATMTLRYKSQVIFNLPSTVISITNSVQGIGYTSTGTITGFANATIQKKTNNDFVMTKSASETTVYENQVFDYIIEYFNNTSTSADVTETIDQLSSNFVVTAVSVQTGMNAPITLDSSDYVLSGANLLTIPSTTGPSIIVPANGNLRIIITGYFN